MNTKDIQRFSPEKHTVHKILSDKKRAASPASPGCPAATEMAYKSSCDPPGGFYSIRQFFLQSKNTGKNYL